jgi:glycosyltransferase involved in cell wall biosynthesis
VRILALTNLYPNRFQPNRAPFIRHKLRVLSEWHDLRVIAPIAWTDELSARWHGIPPTPNGRPVIHDGLAVEHPRYYFPPRVMRRFYGHFFLASVRRTFQRALRDFVPDLVFAPWAFPDGWAATRLARQAGLPVVIMVHGSDILLLDRFPDKRAPTFQAVRSADSVIAVSQDLANHLIRGGVAKDRVHVIYDGVDPNVFHPGNKAAARERLGISNRDQLILFIGNLVPVKAVDVLLDACGMLMRKGIAFRLCIIGHGVLKAALQRQAERLEIAERVTFQGSLPQQQLPDWYRAADLFVLPSHSEGVPNVLLEASACRTPYVASSVGGIPEIAHLGLSKLVPPGDADKLATAMAEHISVVKRDEWQCASTRTHVDSTREIVSVLRTVMVRRNTNATSAPSAVAHDVAPNPRIRAEIGRGRPKPVPPNTGPDVLYGRDMLCFSHDWSGDPLSKTHLMRLLAHDNRVLWVNSIGYRAPTASKADVGRIIRKLKAAVGPISEVEPNLFVLNPLAVPAWGYAGIRKLNSHLLRMQIRKAMRKLGFQRPINWVFNPAAGVIAGSLQEQQIIYYCVDEYKAFSGVPSSSLSELELDLMIKADLVIVSAERLLRSKAQYNPNTVLVRHGVDWEHFRKAIDPATIIPDELAGLPRPLIGYFGLISSDWVDVPLLVHIAQRFPNGSLVMLGKIAMDVSALRALPNVHLLGRKPYNSLPAFCKGFDAAIIPFPLNEATLNANPLKAREYLAAGLPVVSTPIPEVEVLGQCGIGHTPDEFVKRLHEALRQPGPDPVRSRSMTTESWSARLDEIRFHLARIGELGRSARETAT